MSDLEPPPDPTSATAEPEASPPEASTQAAPPDQATAPEASTPKARSGWSPSKILAAAVIGGLVVFGVGLVVGSTTGGDDEAVDADAEAVDAEGEAEDSSSSASVGVDDVAIDYTVLDEACFDSAGSTMEVELSPALASGSDLSLDELNELSFLVTYDITNTEGGVTRGSFDVNNGQFASQTKNLSFETCDTNPNIVVTDVVAR